MRLLKAQYLNVIPNNEWNSDNLYNFSGAQNTQLLILK